MLGLLDLLKAARGSASMALRRVHPLTGPALFALLWVLALGSFFWMAGRDDSSDDEASPPVARTEESTATTGVSDRGDGTSSAEDGSAPTTSLPPGAVPGQISDAEADADARMGQDDAATPPTTTAAANQNRPSWTTTPATTSTSTTASRPPSTTTTTAPPNNGGLIGGLLDALGLG